MIDEHGICDDDLCTRRECRQNRQDTDRAHAFEDRVVHTAYNRVDRRRMRGYRNRPRPMRHPLAAGWS